MNITLNALKFIGIFCTITGILFKILHWYYANELLIISIPIMTLYCIVAAIDGRLSHARGQVQVLGVAMITIHLVMFFKGLPYSHPVILWGGLAFALGGGWFFPKENKAKEEPTMKHHGEWPEDDQEDGR